MADPLAPPQIAALEEIKAVSGLEFLRRIAEGEVPQPPICHTLGFAGRRQQGLRTVHDDAHPQALQSDRHGAWRRGLDAARQLHELRPADQPRSRFELCHPRAEGQFGAAHTEATGPIRAEGRTLHLGRRAGTAEGKILDGNATLLAHGTTSCLVFAL